MPESDMSQRFVIENTGARGELVRLEESYRAIAKQQRYPLPLKKLLGEAMSAALLLSATIKYKGKISLQLQGEGPVNMLLVQATHDCKLRGLVKWNGVVDNLSFRQLVGKSQLAITIEPKAGSRYQGIVPLTGENLAGCLEHYFLQSEQLPTLIRLVADETTAAGFLMQKLPGHEQSSTQEEWNHVAVLAASITAQELLTLSFETLLYRLFHSEMVRLFDPKPVRFECGCSKQTCESAIASLGKDEIKGLIAENEPLDMNCEFCGIAYRLDLEDLQRILWGIDN